MRFLLEATIDNIVDQFFDKFKKYFLRRKNIIKDFLFNDYLREKYEIADFNKEEIFTSFIKDYIQQLLKYILPDYDEYRNYAGAYAKTILKWALKDNFDYRHKLEEYKKTIKKFINFKTRIPVEYRDINRFKNFEEFYRYMSEFQEDLSDQMVKTLAKKHKDRIEIIYEDSDVKILIPLTIYASIYWGSGTSWCTATRNLKNNNFYGYTKPRGDTKDLEKIKTWKEYINNYNNFLTIFISKSGNKLQLYLSEGSIEFNDKNNEPITYENDYKLEEFNIEEAWNNFYKKTYEIGIDIEWFIREEEEEIYVDWREFNGCGAIHVNNIEEGLIRRILDGEIKIEDAFKYFKNNYMYERASIEEAKLFIDIISNIDSGLLKQFVEKLLEIFNISYNHKMIEYIYEKVLGDPENLIFEMKKHIDIDEEYFYGLLWKLYILVEDISIINHVIDTLTSYSSHTHQLVYKEETGNFVLKLKDNINREGFYKLLSFNICNSLPHIDLSNVSFIDDLDITEEDVKKAIRWFIENIQ